MKQLIYFVAGGGLCAMLYFILNLYLWIMVVIVVGALTVTLALFRYNGRPMPALMKSAFTYFWEPRFYLWKRDEPFAQIPKMPKVPHAGAPAGGNLKNLFFRLDTTTQAIGEREVHFNISSLLSKLPHDTKEKFEVIQKNTGERDAAHRVDYR